MQESQETRILLKRPASSTPGRSTLRSGYGARSLGIDARQTVVFRVPTIVSLVLLVAMVMSTTSSFGQMSYFDKYSLNTCVNNCYVLYDQRLRPSEFSQCVDKCRRTYGDLPGLDKDLPKGIR
jgi:hypothetical protein